jgi:hypothetical protein
MTEAQKLQWDELVRLINDAEYVGGRGYTRMARLADSLAPVFGISRRELIRKVQGL